MWPWGARRTFGFSGGSAVGAGPGHTALMTDSVVRLRSDNASLTFFRQRIAYLLSLRTDSASLSSVVTVQSPLLAPILQEKGLMVVKHVAIPGHLRMLVIHEGACCEPCGLLS